MTSIKPLIVAKNNVEVAKAVANPRPANRLVSISVAAPRGAAAR